ncbi:MAG: bifunctional 4-hydroxy-3-methylbut-2-enyl diphosphate reductase/30S ribosomal protein S1 [Monoglobales bacterium]
MAEIIVARTAGFCFGVKRAVSEAEKKVQNEGGVINTYGELIHNPFEVERLKKKGLVPTGKIDEISGNKVIIRTHGVGQDIIDILTEKGCEITDLTCPYVKKIHNIAKKYCKMGIKTVIIGDGAHPEVIGISQRCSENSVILQDKSQVKDLISEAEPIAVVAQTTLNRNTFEEIKNEVLSINPSAEIFDTICSATTERQEEAKQIAQRSDAFFVVGGKNSSNTKKLFEVAEKVCKNTYHIECAGDIKKEMLAGKNIIGITAGASTPDQIIKEVYNTMENLTNQETLNFEELLEESLNYLNTGDTVSGIVVDVRPTEVVLELSGCKYNGIIDLDNLSGDPSLSPADLVKVGDEIEAFVIQVDDHNGQIRLSRKKLEQEKSREALKKAFEAEEILEGEVIEVVKGGMNVLIGETVVFVPASQASDRFVEDLNQFAGEKVQLRIIDMGTQGRRRRVVGSVKSVLKEETKRKRDAFWAEAAEGKTYTGKVKSLTAFGAFVDIGGVDGLVHISQLSWKKISHPSQVVKEGDEIEVFIKSLDREKQKISLGSKKEEDNPWTKFMADYKLGDIATGTVVRLVPFGAFVDIGGVDGLIHISDISWRRISHPSEVLSEGQSVEVIIKNIDEEKQKISLGYKRIEDNPWEIFKSKYSVGDTVKAKVVRLVSFGAFAEIIDGVDGLIHISQISYDRINNVSDALKAGDEVEAKIIEIKESDGKVSLSIKALLTPPATENEEAIEETVEEDMPMSVGTENTATQFELAVEEAEKEANEAE